MLIKRFLLQCSFFCFFSIVATGLSLAGENLMPLAQYAANYAAWANACSDPAGATVRSDFLSRANLLPADEKAGVIQQFENNYKIKKLQAEARVKKCISQGKTDCCSAVISVVKPLNKAKINYESSLQRLAIAAPPTESSGSGQGGRIPKLNKNGLSEVFGAINDIMLNRLASADGTIVGCGGMRDPAFRENALTLIEVRFAKIPSLIDDFIKLYDERYQLTMGKIASQNGCANNAVEGTYKNYPATHNYILEASANYAAKAAKEMAKPVPPEPPPRIITGANGELFDCEHGVGNAGGTNGPNSIGALCTQQTGKNVRNSPLSILLAYASQYEAWADVCGEPSGTEVMQDALSRLSRLTPANRNALIKAYEQNRENWRKRNQETLTGNPDSCMIHLPRTRNQVDAALYGCGICAPRNGSGDST